MTNLLRRILDQFGRYVFNARFAYFEYNGTARTAADMLGVVSRRVDDVGTLVSSLTKSLAAGDTTVAEWREAFAVELRRATSQMYALGRGGWAQMTAEDRALVTDRLKSEFGYLQQFAQDIQAGNLSEAQIEARMNMYGNAIRSSYYEGERTAKEAAGYTMERRVLNPGESCPDCIEYAGMDWQPIGTLPAIGDSQCLGNCNCNFEYSGD